MSDDFSFKYIIYFCLDEEKCVVYSNNGTAQSGAGTYVVKPMTIKWKTNNFSNLGVITESRSTLTEQSHIGYPASSAASSHKYSFKDIVTKVDFILTDSTAHNLNKVIEKVKKISYENCFSFQ